MSGVVAWLTGLPSSGKSTLAAKAAAALRARGVSCVVLDGDEVRGRIRPTPGYDDAGRDAFYETLAGLAGYLATQGAIVLVPATAHRRAFRDRARALAPRFLEVFVDTPPEVCHARDAKGLYAAAASDGNRGSLPGAGARYEAPDAPDLRTHGDEGDAARLVEACLRAVSTP